MPGGSRSREGCFNCRKRKRRCDEEKPVCRRCRKTRDDCVFPEPASTSNLKFVVAASDHYLVPTTTQNTSFLNLSPQELVSICDHFKGRVPLPRTLSPFLFESQGNKAIEQSLVQYFIPRMFQGPLLSAVLAMSAAEWAQNVPNGDYQALSVQYKVRALHELQQALLDSQGSEGNLLTCVLLASLEIAHGSCPTWLQHLQGALALLESFGTTIDPNVAEFVLQYFRFRYILMETTQPSHEEDPYRQAMVKLARAEANLPHARNLVDEQIGCSMDLVDIINEISSLSTNTSNDLHAKGQEIEQRIEHLSQDNVDEYLSKSAESFRIAAQIYLRLVCYNTPITHPSILEPHEALLLCLSNIIVEGQTRRSFPMWPLFLAGCACSSDQQRKVVLDHFALLDSQWPISNISAVWNALKLIWHTRDLHTSSSNQDWREVVHKFGWKLSLS
ncbi:fungal-specific transcription factor domain-containing protein [Fusarium avenaceum]|nr:fungal-specific transcription factor domain-containing protein [Fusarium avenaceum]